MKSKLLNYFAEWISRKAVRLGVINLGLHTEAKLRVGANLHIEVGPQHWFEIGRMVQVARLPLEIVGYGHTQPPPTLVAPLDLHALRS